MALSVHILEARPWSWRCAGALLERSGPRMIRAGIMTREKIALPSSALLISTWMIAAPLVAACGALSDEATKGIATVDCAIDVSYAGHRYIQMHTQHFVRPGKELGSGTYEYCGNPGGAVTVARVPGFSPQRVIRLVHARDKLFVFVREGTVQGTETANELPPRLRMLQAGGRQHTQ